MAGVLVRGEDGMVVACDHAGRLAACECWRGAGCCVRQQRSCKGFDNLRPFSSTHRMPMPTHPSGLVSCRTPLLSCQPLLLPLPPPPLSGGPLHHRRRDPGPGRPVRGHEHPGAREEAPADCARRRVSAPPRLAALPASSSAGEGHRLLSVVPCRAGKQPLWRQLHSGSCCVGRS